MPKYTDQFGRVLYVPAIADERKQHLAAKHIAKANLTPQQRAQYEAGEFNLHVVDELGRRHVMMYGAKGTLGLKRG